MKQPDPVERRYVLHFNESVRGLSVGAPVTLFGLRVGEVTNVSTTFDPRRLIFALGARSTFFPDRLVGQMSAQQQATTGNFMTEMTNEARLRMMRRIVEEKGLRLRRPGYHRRAVRRIRVFRTRRRRKSTGRSYPLEPPVVPGGLAILEAKLGSILTKIDSMPLDAIAGDVKNALVTLNLTLKDADTLVNSVTRSCGPRAPRPSSTRAEAIASADQALKNADSTPSARTRRRRNLPRDASQELNPRRSAPCARRDYLDATPRY